MRWDDLFADLEASFESGLRAADERDVADLTRAERARVTMAERLSAHTGQVLDLVLRADEETLAGRLVDTGSDWILVEPVTGSGPDGRDPYPRPRVVRPSRVLVPLHAVGSVGGMSRMSSPATGVARRLGLGVVLRGLATERAAVIVRVAGGGSCAGTIDRVGADHVDVALHARDEPRRASAVTAVRCVLTAAVLTVAVPDGRG